MSDVEPARRRPRRAAGVTPPPSTPDPVEIAMETAASGRAPGEAALEVLRVSAALTREQIGLARNERFRNRIKAVRDMALASLVLVVLGGLGVVVWAASQAEGLVVEPIATPPDMAAQGLDGAVLAARLLDRLGAMQAATDSSRAPASFGNNWTENLEVEVPQTGLSVGEAWRMLRQGLGDETRLSGDLTRTATGYVLTTRVGANPGVAVTGGPDDLDRMLDQAAEAVFRQAQPYRYAVWLNRSGGGGDAIILAGLAASGDRTERLWALVGQSVNALGDDPEQALAFAREALALDPTFHKARWNVADALEVLGRAEANLSETRLIERAMRRRDPRVTTTAQNQVLHSARGAIAEWTGDFATMAAEARIRGALPDYSGNAGFARYEVARALIALHDWRGAMAAIRAADRSLEPLPARSAYLSAMLADARGDAEASALTARAMAVDGADGTLPLAADRATLAVLAVRAGDVAGARAMLNGTAADCYPCVIALGRIAALEGNPAEAERLLTRATRMGPSLPAAWQALGRTRLDRRDFDGAAAAFREAADRAPRWADPLKFQGDILAARGDHRAAIRNYRAAAERAPRWGGLHLAWGRALEADGRREEAVAQYRAAAGMDLSAADRADLTARLARQRAA